jgi:hypothetical protein
MAVVFKHIHDPLPPPRRLHAALPETLERVILKALAKSPQDRFATANEMVKALQASLQETTPSSHIDLDPGTNTIIGQPAETTHAVALSRPLWQPILLTAISWVIGTVIGIIFSSLHPILGALVAGAIGGLGIGLAWQQVDPSVSRRQIFVLAAIWTPTLGLAIILGPLFFVAGGLAGWFSGMVLRKAQPKLRQKQLAFITLGWGISWIIGGILVTIATTAFVELASALLVIIAMFLAGGIGATIMFRQYLQGFEAAATKE